MKWEVQSNNYLPEYNTQNEYYVPGYMKNRKYFIEIFFIYNFLNEKFKLNLIRYINCIH